MDFTGTLKKGFYAGIALTWDMIKVIVPFYFVVELIKYLGLIEFIGRFFRPFMSLLGLPGPAALGLIAGYTTNLYAAIAVIAPLQLSARDVTIIALMLGICHSLPIETPITKKTGVNAWRLLAVRLGLSFLVGAILNLLWPSSSPL
jgi:hypothetical protein